MSDSITETSKAWLLEVGVNQFMVNFKVDTGAAVTAIPSNLKNHIGNATRSNKKLKGAGNHELVVTGQAEVTLSAGTKRVVDTVYFVENLASPLLGKPAISKLGLIQFVGTVDSNERRDWKRQHPRLFRGLGAMDTQVRIVIDSGVEPFVQSVPRRVAAARKQPLKEELTRMEKLGVIEKIERPTEWCAPCIAVPKKNGKLRVCIDFTNLNKSVKREYHPLPTSEEALAELGQSRVFSKLDANCGYWQLRLHPDSRELTTFITPFGRYVCNRLPFGISSAPEIFQREMHKVLMGLEGVICQMDDILVHGKSKEEHYVRLEKVLAQLEKAGITLNEDKCEFEVTETKFIGHIIDHKGIRADPEKTRAIRDFPVPSNRRELKRFFGIVNYLGKFTPLLADRTHLLRQLLGKECEWVWGEQQDAQFRQVKEILTTTPVLVPYSLTADTMLSADSSSYGLGAAILQKVHGEWKPVAYASRALTSTEQRYAQIEKEALAIAWACDKFNYYLAGRSFVVETDHKPLLAVLGSKELSKLPIRVQRFRLKMMAYTYSIVYTPGKHLVLADALSRSPVEEKVVTRGNMRDSNIVLEILSDLPIATHRLSRIRAAILEDELGLLLSKYITQGWPEFKEIPEVAKSCYSFRDLLTYVDGIIFYNHRVFIPLLERNKVLEDIHKSHQGETKCIRRATEVVWWPGMTAAIRELVRGCSQCEKFCLKPREPLKTTPMPERPWWRLAMDLFQKDQKMYLLVIDYFSRFITVHELKDSSNSRAIVEILEELFCTLGVPNTIVSDNGPQFVSEEVRNFLRKWDIQHVTSSPRFPQSNGEAERAVRTVKELMNKNINLHAALCMYRDTPLANGYSPAQLLFGRSLNSMGIMPEGRIDLNKLRNKEELAREKQISWYDRRYSTRPRPNLEVSQPVVINEPSGNQVPATVIGTRGREVVARSQANRLFRRNRAHVRGRDSEITRSEEQTPPGQDAPNIPRSPHRTEESRNQIVLEDPTVRQPIGDEHHENTQEAQTHAKEGSSVSKSPYVTRSGRQSKAPKRLNL